MFKTQQIKGSKDDNTEIWYNDQKQKLKEGVNTMFAVPFTKQTGESKKPNNNIYYKITQN